MDKDYENYNPYELASLLASQQALAQGVQQLAMRPQKESVYTTSTSTPRALADLIKTRDTIGGATTDLASALRGRENWGYALGNILSGVQADSTPGGWLAGLARGAGAGLTTMENIKQDNAKQLYDARMQDLANRLAYDKAMGETQTQNQRIGYKEMPYGAAGGKGAGSGSGSQQQVEQKVYDITPAEMPEIKPVWGEIELRSEQLKDPDTRARTFGGLAAKFVAERTNPEAREAMVANQQAYTNTFTQDAITEIAQKMGGSRGIDTVPEINIKGGPELSGDGMGSKQFESSVKDQAWSAADQIVKANPKTTVTRAEIANALINNFNHSIRPEYRLVGQLPTNYTPGNSVAKQIAGTASQGKPTTNGYDYSKYGF